MADELLDCLDYASMGIYSKRAAATAEKESQISFASAGLMRKLFYWSLVLFETTTQDCDFGSVSSKLHN